MSDELVKMVALIPKRADLSDQQFFDHWLHHHGPLAANVPVFRRYVQLHRRDLPGLPPADAPHAGAAEIWFDSMQAFQRMGDDEVYARTTADDEPNFCALTEDAYRFVASERVIRDGGLGARGDRGIKLLQTVRRRDDLGIDEFGERWAGEGEEEIGRRLGVVRHVVCPALAANYDFDLADVTEGGGGHHWLPADPCDGVRELWWSDAQSLREAVSSDPEAWRAVVGDPLIDAARSPAFFGVEHVLK